MVEITIAIALLLLIVPFFWVLYLLIPWIIKKAFE